ncbi:MAG: low molecular weight phosphotyrosine protein phosphatase [Myxococcales bacterium]|nr:low molecular weight phosphotyrosine protein phosphatase [Myxococcales bacterium]
MGAMVRICFVCLGNICRSPTAEGVMRHLVEAAGLSAHVEIDSAGTAAYHIGKGPDHRSRQAAAARGIVIGGQARQFTPADWERFDYVLAMDSSNYEDLIAHAPPEAKQKLRLLRSFDPASPPGAPVPDPYYGGAEGFDEVLDLCEAACRGLLDHLKREHGLQQTS